MSPGSGKGLRYNGNKRSNTDGVCRRTRYCQKREGSKKPREENLDKRSVVSCPTRMAAILKTNAAISPTEKKWLKVSLQNREQQMSRQDKRSDPDGSSGDSSAALSERSSQLSGRTDSQLDHDGRGQK